MIRTSSEILVWNGCKVFLRERIINAKVTLVEFYDPWSDISGVPVD